MQSSMGLKNKMLHIRADRAVTFATQLCVSFIYTSIDLYNRYVLNFPDLSIYKVSIHIIYILSFSLSLSISLLYLRPPAIFM